MAAMGASWSPRSPGSRMYSRRSPPLTSMTREGPVVVSSSIASAPWKTSACVTPRRASTSAILPASASSATPSAWRCAPAGLQSGPSTLKTVRTPSSRRGTVAYLNEGWNTGANKKPMPVSAMQRATPSGPRSMRTPSASNTSALPHWDEAARLPCLATRAPQAAATMPLSVEMLKVPSASPPVPQVSTRPSASISIGVAYARAVRTRPVISSVDSPLIRSATTKPAIWEGVASPFMITSIACAASASVWFCPRTRLPIASSTRRLPRHTEEVGEQLAAFQSQHRLRVELHAVGPVALVPEAHDDPVMRPGADLELVRDGAGIDHQGMVSSGLEGDRQAREWGPAVVVNPARHPVPRRVAPDRAAEGLAESLVAEADAQDGQVPGELPDRLERDAGIVWRAGTRRDHEGVEPSQVGRRDRVVTEDRRLRARLVAELDQVEGEGVVVIDDPHPDLPSPDSGKGLGGGRHGMPSACSIAAKRTLALASVSWYSRCGSESATIPAPAWT